MERIRELGSERVVAIGGGRRRDEVRGRAFRCRIARLRGGVIQTMTYIGPVDRIPAGWSLVMRRVTGSAA